MYEDDTDDLAHDFACAVLDGFMPLVILTEPSVTLLLCNPETDRSMRAIYSPSEHDRAVVMIACAMYGYNEN